MWALFEVHADFLSQFDSVLSLGVNVSVGGCLMCSDLEKVATCPGVKNLPSTPKSAGFNRIHHLASKVQEKLS